MDLKIHLIIARWKFMANTELFSKKTIISAIDFPGEGPSKQS